jgi:hypothetical protein
VAIHNPMVSGVLLVAPVLCGWEVAAAVRADDLDHQIARYVFADYRHNVAGPSRRRSCQDPAVRTRLSLGSTSSACGRSADDALPALVGATDSAASRFRWPSMMARNLGRARNLGIEIDSSGHSRRR